MLFSSIVGTANDGFQIMDESCFSAGTLIDCFKKKRVDDIDIVVTATVSDTLRTQRPL